jgi:hypothetical protein
MLYLELYASGAYMKHHVIAAQSFCHEIDTLIENVRFGISVRSLKLSEPDAPPDIQKSIYKTILRRRWKKLRRWQ